MKIRAPKHAAVSANLSVFFYRKRAVTDIHIGMVKSLTKVFLLVFSLLPKKGRNYLNTLQSYSVVPYSVKK